MYHLYTRQAWCAVDPVESPNCGTKSTSASAGMGPGKYGWVRWDYCEAEILKSILLLTHT